MLCLSHPASPCTLGVPAPALAPRGEPCKPGSARSSGEGSGALRQARCRGHGLQPPPRCQRVGAGPAPGDRALVTGEKWPLSRARPSSPGPTPSLHRALSSRLALWWPRAAAPPAADDAVPLVAERSRLVPSTPPGRPPICLLSQTPLTSPKCRSGVDAGRETGWASATAGPALWRPPDDP